MWGQGSRSPLDSFGNTCPQSAKDKKASVKQLLYNLPVTGNNNNDEAVVILWKLLYKYLPCGGMSVL